MKLLVLSIALVTIVSVECASKTGKKPKWTEDEKEKVREEVPIPFPDCQDTYVDIKEAMVQNPDYQTDVFAWFYKGCEKDCKTNANMAEVIKYEPWALEMTHFLFKWLRTAKPFPLDVNKICSRIVDEKKIFEMYRMMKKKCADGTPLMTKKDLCHITKDDPDIKRVGDCVKAEIGAMAKKYMFPPPADCLPPIMKLCEPQNRAGIIHWFDFWLWHAFDKGLRSKISKQLPPKLNPFIKVEAIFKAGCKFKKGI